MLIDFALPAYFCYTTTDITAKINVIKYNHVLLKHRLQLRQVDRLLIKIVPIGEPQLKVEVMKIFK